MHTRPMRTAKVPMVLCLLCLFLLLQTGAQEPSGQEPLWNLAWITDTQTPECEHIAALVAKVQANRPKMVIHTGDTRFEWANQCAWKTTLDLLRNEMPPLEFHLAPGNHDDEQAHTLRRILSRAATQGTYPIDTGVVAQGYGYYHNRVTADATGPFWPVWNPEIARHPNWQPGAGPPYRYIFRRGGIRFIVCDCYYSDEQRDWVRQQITQPDDSAVTILLQHEHIVDKLARYFEGLDGQHNVKLVLSGHDHHYLHTQRHGVTFITGAGIATGSYGDCDAMTLWVYPDRLRLDRYVLPLGAPLDAIRGPETIWEFSGGGFTPYQRPAMTSD